MTILPPEFDSELAARRAAIVDARQKLTIMEAELRGLEVAMSLLVSARSRSAPVQTAHRDEDDSEDGPRRVKGRWAKLMALAAGLYPKALSLDDWAALAQSEGFDLVRGSIRSQMSTYTTWGLVERISDGLYRITEAGAEAAKTSLPKAASADHEFDMNVALGLPPEIGSTSDGEGL